MSAVSPIESNVSVYNRMFPAVFDRAAGAEIWDRDGRRHIDFLAGAGALNYGHNPPEAIEAMMAYLGRGGVISSLDMMTAAKEAFLEALGNVILAPRGLTYRVQFTGPTGANAVEAALKLARMVTGRSSIVAFTGAFHGVTLGALAVTGNGSKRAVAGTSLADVVRMPYDGHPGGDAARMLAALLDDPSSGIEPPAAIIVESLQGEGGINPASRRWLSEIAALARQHGALLILDDIQMGCGRTGSFFSHEPLGIDPDIVVMSKSISGAGLPMALVLLRPDLDQWQPGQHNGTFRGNNLAFVAATAMLEAHWRDASLSARVEEHHWRVMRALAPLADQDPALQVRGRGLAIGLEWTDAGRAQELSRRCFDRGLIVETAGARDQVLKLLPPLTIPMDLLDEGLSILCDTITTS